MSFLKSGPLRRLRGQEIPLSSISDLEKIYRDITRSIMDGYGKMADIQISQWRQPGEKQREMLCLRGRIIFLKGEQQVALLRLKAAYLLQLGR